MTPSDEQVLEALKRVYDPEIPVDIVNLGLVYEATVEDGTARVTMTTTAPGCPVGDYLTDEIERAVRKLPGVSRATVTFVWDPPWHPDMMSPEAKRCLGW